MNGEPATSRPRPPASRPRLRSRYHDAMVTRERLFGLGALLAAACSLTTSLDGFTGGAVDGGAPEGSTSEASTPDRAAPDTGGPDASNTAYAAAVRADRPLGWWRLDERSGTKAKDEAAAHDGTYVGSVTFRAAGAIVGDPDTAVALDGTSGALRIADTFDASGTQPFSIELWLNPTSTSGDHRLASRRTGNSETGYRFMFSGDQLRLERWQDGGLSGAAALAPLPKLNRWTHVVGTYNGAVLRIYADGAEVGSGSSPGAVSASSAIFVWASNSLADADYFAGSVDELAIYDHALEPDRIAAHTRAAGH